jgi:hypothetical protein
VLVAPREHPDLAIAGGAAEHVGGLEVARRRRAVAVDVNLDVGERVPRGVERPEQGLPAADDGVGRQVLRRAVVEHDVGRERGAHQLPLVQVGAARDGRDRLDDRRAVAVRRGQRLRGVRGRVLGGGGGHGRLQVSVGRCGGTPRAREHGAGGERHAAQRAHRATRGGSGCDA